MKRAKVRDRQWNRYVERLPAGSKTHPGFTRSLSPGRAWGIFVRVDGAWHIATADDYNAAVERVDSAYATDVDAGRAATERPQPTGLRFRARNQGRRR